VGRGSKLATLAGGLGVYALAVRPRLLTWGATEEEVRDPYPGDGLIPDTERGSIMATTIEAPPSRVWPWLVQMGLDRGGWYSWDWLDHLGVPSAERIHPEWQQISVGDRLTSTPHSAWFAVAAIEPERFLALRASLDLRGRSFDPAGPRPRFYSDSLWCFLLTEASPGQTRLVIGTYTQARPRLPFMVANLLFWEPAHWVMQVRQFANLKRRVEHI
jgi:hypothetical protein